MSSSSFLTTNSHRMDHPHPTTLRRRQQPPQERRTERVRLLQHQTPEALLRSFMEERRLQRLNRPLLDPLEALDDYFDHDPDVERRRREIAVDVVDNEEDEHYDNLPDLLPYDPLEEQVQQQQVQTTTQEEPATPMEGARRRATNFSAHLVSPEVEDFNDYDFLTSSSWQPQQQLSPNAFTTPREEELSQNDTASTLPSPTLQRQSGNDDEGTLLLPSSDRPSSIVDMIESSSPSSTREDWSTIQNSVLPVMQQRHQGVPERLTADILERRRRLEQDDPHRRQQVVVRDDMTNNNNEAAGAAEEAPPPNNTHTPVATVDARPPLPLYTLNFGRSVLLEEDSSIDEEESPEQQQVEFTAEDEI